MQKKSFKKIHQFIFVFLILTICDACDQAKQQNLNLDICSVTAINISPLNSNVQSGAIEQFTAIGTFSNGSTQDITSQVIWSSSNTSFVSISSEGLAIGIVPGESNIMAELPKSCSHPIVSNEALINVVACFNNSTWVVPPQTLLAYLYDNANVTPVTDQTVWVISNYNQGYFSGQSYTAINNSILSERYLIGSVTSEGQVYITFYSGTSTSTDLVTGLGNLYVQSSGQCSFTMQMNSGQNGVSGLTHWSYMIPVNPGDVFYNNLPGTNMSVPQFLAQF